MSIDSGDFYGDRLIPFPYTYFYDCGDDWEVMVYVDYPDVNRLIDDSSCIFNINKDLRQCGLPKTP